MAPLILRRGRQIPLCRFKRVIPRSFAEGPFGLVGVLGECDQLSFSDWERLLSGDNNLFNAVHIYCAPLTMIAVCLRIND